jgi:hypothetical protein
MPNGTISNLTCLLPRTMGDRGSTASARSSMSSSTSSEAAASGACFLTTLLEMAHRLPLLQKMALREGTWERVNGLSENACGSDCGETLSLVQPQWIASRSRVPQQAEKSAVTTGPRWSKDASAIFYWWIRKASCSRDYERGSKCYLSVLGSSSCASVICGWTPATGREQRQGLGTEKALGWSVELVERVRAKLPPRRCSDEVGGGISQGRQEGRLARALASPRISRLAAPLGSGALLCLDRP